MIEIENSMSNSLCKNSLQGPYCAFHNFVNCPTVYDSDISYSYFFKYNLEKNEPCIFGKWLTQKWLARQEWVIAEKDINYELLTESFGSSDVPVANCQEKYYDSQKKDTFIFEDYLKYLKSNSKSKECLYLKDWHFVKNFSEYGAYEIPPFFASDWLNEFWCLRTDINDDYKFVYIGPRGSWTPFHADVFRSFSWSTNICGRKRWVLYPPGEEENMKDSFGNLIFDVEAPELNNKSHSANADLPSKRLDVIQEAGQTIFVPSNWHHQVWNLEDTISVNHNWINATNIMSVWEFLFKSLKEVEKSIEDCSTMEGWSKQCQLILKSVHGMDFKEYYQFLKAISLRRLKYLEGDVSISSFPEWKFGKNLVVYDVEKLIKCLELLMDDPHSDVLKCLEENDHPTTLLDQLQSAL